jgi:hypothetical protein
MSSSWLGESRQASACRHKRIDRAVGGGVLDVVHRSVDQVLKPLERKTATGSAGS